MDQRAQQFVGGVDQRRHHGDACVVVDRVDRTQFGFDAAEGGANGGGVSDVQADGEHLGAVDLEQCCRSREIVLGTGQDRDVGSLAGQGLCGGQPDPRGGSRDHGDTVGHCGHRLPSVERIQSICATSPRSRDHSGV